MQMDIKRIETAGIPVDLIFDQGIETLGLTKFYKPLSEMKMQNMGGKGKPGMGSSGPGGPGLAVPVLMVPVLAVLVLAVLVVLVLEWALPVSQICPVKLVLADKCLPRLHCQKNKHTIFVLLNWI